MFVINTIININVITAVTPLDFELLESRMHVHCLAHQKHFMILLNKWLLFKFSEIQIHQGFVFILFYFLHLYKRKNSALWFLKGGMLYRQDLEFSIWQLIKYKALFKDSLENIHGTYEWESICSLKRVYGT